MAVANEFSRPIPIEAWPEGGVAFEVTATPEERAAVAARLGLLAVDRLEARGRLERTEPGGVVRLDATLDAAVAQECVVSLEPVAGRLVEPVRRFFRADAAAATAAADELVVDPEAEDIEPLAGASLDVGEVVVEELALGLDPYPRAPDAVERVGRGLGPNVGLNEPEERNRPFAALRRSAAR